MALDALYAGLFALAALGLFEALEPGSVARFFNLTWLVGWCLAASFAAFATHGDHHSTLLKQEGAGGVIVFLFAVVGAWAAWRWTEGLPIAWRVAASAGTLIVGFLLLVITKKHDL